MGWRRLLSDNSDARQGYRRRDNPHRERFGASSRTVIEYTNQCLGVFGQGPGAFWRGGSEASVVLLPDPGSHLIVDEWQECVASTARDLVNRMQNVAGKDNRPAGRRLVAVLAVLREPEIAALEISAQIDRHGEAAMGGDIAVI